MESQQLKHDSLQREVVICNKGIETIVFQLGFASIMLMNIEMVTWGRHHKEQDPHWFMIVKSMRRDSCVLFLSESLIWQFMLPCNCVELLSVVWIPDCSDSVIDLCGAQYLWRCLWESKLPQVSLWFTRELHDFALSPLSCSAIGLPGSQLSIN